MPVPEVVELPALGEVLGAAMLYLAWIVTLGMLWAYRRSLKLVILKFADIIDISVLHQHPFGGVAKWLRAQAKNIDTLLAEAVTASERGAVVLFKLFLNTQLWIARETADLATDVWHAIRGVEHQTVTKLTKVVTHTVVKPITTTVTIVKGTSATIAKQITASVHALGARVAHLEHVVAHDAAIAAPRVGITSKQLRRLLRRTSALEKATVGLGAVALVAAAMRRMELGWLRCPSLLRMGRRLGCVGFGWIESFFATAFEALVVLDLCRFALAAQQLAKLLVPQLAGTLLVQNAVCLGGGASYPSAHDSPKVSTRLVLPSAHD